MTQETTQKQDLPIISATDKKKQPSPQELVDSLKSTAEDIGQISELSGEEKILIGQFFASLLKLMGPLTPSIAINQLVLPPQFSDVTQAHVDPTGHLVLQYTDEHVELLDLSQDNCRELLITVVSDIIPKFKNLTSQQRKKLENRIKLLSIITKELQKSSETLATAFSTNK